MRVLKPKGMNFEDSVKYRQLKTIQSSDLSEDQKVKVNQQIKDLLQQAKAAAGS